jgi:3-hydroxyisobutyrate dehydrogenase|tara:strand:- start:467 stop:1081 length:615 start_codon:yes stop_codon:yes gene_type:complete
VQKNKPDYYNDLDKVYIKIWNLLVLGLKDRNAPFHIPVLITGNKSEFDGRIVVLRGVDVEEKKIWFHSDIRSNKVKVLKSNPKGTLLFYDKVEKIQLRVFGKTKINYHNDVTRKAWSKTSHMSRQCYLGEDSPGKNTSFATSGLSNDIDNSKYTLEESEIGYKNFCLIEISITDIEWLYLAAKGHRRAFFNLKNKIIKKKWLIP